jgi:predicted dehydrogenase
MSAKKTYNWAVLGCGKIAQKFSKDLQLLDKANLYACASRDLNKAKKFADNFGFQKAYGSYSEMVCDPEIDIVYIATPHTFHKRHALLCLEQKKAVLCEKAFAINEKEVLQMIAASKKHKTFLMEAFWTRFVPTFQKVLEIIESKELGDLKTVHSDFLFHAPYDPKSRLYNRDLGGGSLLDIGIYPVFTALMTLGIPEKIHAEAQLSPSKSDAYMFLSFQYPENKAAHLVSGFTCNSFNDSAFYFEKGSVRISRDMNKPILISKNGEQKTLQVDDGNGYGYQFEANHVMECLDKNLTESPLLPLTFSLNLIQLLDKIRKKTGIVYPNHDTVPSDS